MGSTFVVDSHGLPDNVVRNLTSMVFNGEIQHILPGNCNGNCEAKKRVDFVNDLLNRLQDDR
jgi:hypothetical protein